MGEGYGERTEGSGHNCVMSNFFFFNDTATTEIYTLSLHDALPIFCSAPTITSFVGALCPRARGSRRAGDIAVRHLPGQDRKSTRLNSSHANISYAVFCLKKKTHHNPSPFSLSISLSTSTCLSSQSS